MSVSISISQFSWPNWVWMPFCGIDENSLLKIFTLQEKSNHEEKHKKDIAIKMKQIVRLEAKLKKSEKVSPCGKYLLFISLLIDDLLWERKISKHVNWFVIYFIIISIPQNMLFDLLFFHNIHPSKSTQGVLMPFHGQWW